MRTLTEPQPPGSGCGHLPLQGNLPFCPGERPQDDTAGTHHAFWQAGGRGGSAISPAHACQLAGLHGGNRQGPRRRRIARYRRIPVGCSSPIWLGSVLEPKRLSRRVAKQLSDPDSDIWMSPISTWKILVLNAKVQLSLGPDPHQWTAETMTRAPFREAEAKIIESKARQDWLPTRLTQGFTLATTTTPNTAPPPQQNTP